MKNIIISLVCLSISACSSAIDYGTNKVTTEPILSNEYQDVVEVSKAVLFESDNDIKSIKVHKDKQAQDLMNLPTYDTSNKNKNSIGVLLTERITEEQAKIVGERLSMGQTDDFYVFFHLYPKDPAVQMNVSFDDWANYNKKRKKISHYNNNPFFLLGLSKKDYEELSMFSETEPGRKVIGQWLDIRSGEKVTYYELENKFFVEKYTGTKNKKSYEVEKKYNGDGVTLYFKNILPKYRINISYKGHAVYENKKGPFAELENIKFFNIN